MNAATLMTSGTVTKKPAMKLRRSHWTSDDRRLSQQACPQREPPSWAWRERTRTRPQSRGPDRAPCRRRSSRRDRETPGISASTWPAPMPSAAQEACRSASSTDGARPSRSTSSIDDAAEDERGGDHAGAVVEHRRRRSRQAARRRGGPAGNATRIITANRRAAGAMAGRCTHRGDLDAIQPHDGENRAELDHDGEDAAGSRSKARDARR